MWCLRGAIRNISTRIQKLAPKMSHRRYNPLLNEWVLVAANRINRPWQGDREVNKTDGKNSTTVGLTTTDVKNPLAPGGMRASGMQTPLYTSTYVFQNDFPSLTDQSTVPPGDGELFRAQEAKGTCRVICYHPDTRITLGLMSCEEIERVIDVWIDQMNELKEQYEWVQIFENRGTVMGCSNQHPHGQLWASNYLPTNQEKMYVNQKSYKERTGKVMLMEYLMKELEKKERIVLENKDWVVLVPFWAYWPFETMVLPKRHVKALYDITMEEKQSLASALKVLLVKYDNIFKCSFPFAMGWHGAPTGKWLKEDNDFWTLHAVFYPPLLRSADVKKFTAGYELLAEGQRDITPEGAAKLLREQSEIHYKDASSSSSSPMSS